jgi:S2P endopeptidase
MDFDRDSIPLVSCGASLTAIIPSAFVSFSSSSLASLHPPAKARITAAGPFHNLVTWVLLMTAKVMGIGGVIRSMGYINVSSIGRNIVSVESVSFECLSGFEKG